MRTEVQVLIDPLVNLQARQATELLRYQREAVEMNKQILHLKNIVY